jgi:two-component system response regulator FixJ
MSGQELKSKLAASDCRVPIIFISGHGDGDLRTRAMEAGAVDFLQKPFGEKALFDAINSSLLRYSSAAADLSD